MPVRKASAVWNGSLKEGSGTMSLGSGAYQGAYSFASRFEEASGTNPEELIGGAHAGCFSMALSGGLGRAGYTPTKVETEARVHLGRDDAGPRIELVTRAHVPGIPPEVFQEQAKAAKENCPVSRALAGVQIELDAQLV
jgi:osmotically inducible protein OsmC